jgi:hypothetical protein
MTGPGPMVAGDDVTPVHRCAISLCEEPVVATAIGWSPPEDGRRASALVLT